MKLIDVTHLIEVLKKEISTHFKQEEVSVKLENDLHDKKEQFLFDEESILTLKDYGKIPVFALEVQRLSNNPEETPTVLYTDVYVDGIMVPLLDDGSTTQMEMSIHYGEKEEGDLDIDRFVITDDKQYGKMMNELYDTIVHQFGVFVEEMKNN